MASSVKKRELTQSDVRAAFDYDAQTGILLWKEGVGASGRRIRCDLAGQVAGCRDSVTGYWRVYLLGHNRHAHRLIWLWMTGETPEEQIDHANRDRSDNRWKNLRLASQSVNNGNHPMRSDNTSGYKGVSWSSTAGRWWVQLKVDKKHHNLGYYDDPIEAAKAYDAAARRLFGEFARVNFGDGATA